ncbi:hypothetical protein pb186bvf_010169 [Paramecium bursaria]
MFILSPNQSTISSIENYPSVSSYYWCLDVNQRQYNNLHFRYGSSSLIKFDYKYVLQNINQDQQSEMIFQLKHIKSHYLNHQKITQQFYVGLKDQYKNIIFR